MSSELLTLTPSPIRVSTGVRLRTPLLTSPPLSLETGVAEKSRQFAKSGSDSVSHPVLVSWSTECGLPSGVYTTVREDEENDSWR